VAVVECYWPFRHWPENTDGNDNDPQRAWLRFEPGPYRCAFRGVSSVYDTEIVYCVLLRNEFDTKAAHWNFFKNLPGKTTKRKLSFTVLSEGEQFRRLTSLRRSLIRYLNLTDLLASHVEIVLCSNYIFMSRSSLLLTDSSLESLTATALKERRILISFGVQVSLIQIKVPNINCRPWLIFYEFYPRVRCARWRSWLRHCATSRKVAGSIPDGVTGIFYWHNPSGRTMSLGLTQPLTERSTRNNSWGVKAAGAYGWQSYHLHVPIVLKSGSLKLLEAYGPVQACNGIVFAFTLVYWLYVLRGLRLSPLQYVLSYVSSTFYVVWGNSATFCLQAGKRTFSAQNEE
jgi:hypothetical protein